MLDDIKPSEIEDWYDYNDQLSADDEISQLVWNDELIDSMVEKYGLYLNFLFLSV